MISLELFEAAQHTRIRNYRNPDTVNKGAQTYSLSGLMRSTKCDSKMRIQMSPKGQSRIYCAGRAGGLGCTCRGTFLRIYEGQVRWYMGTFTIPRNYQDRLLAAHKELHQVVDHSPQRKNVLQARLRTIEEMYEWGHKSKERYLADYAEIQRELDDLRPVQDRSENLERLAHFLGDVNAAWDQANQTQRNKLARALFEEVRVEDSRVVAVKPRPELEPFFRLNLGCQPRDIAGDPDRI